MKINLTLILTILLFPTLLLAQDKFDRVIVFPGGGMDPAIFIGMYDAAIESGWKPDVIVATCGGAISATLIKAYPNPRERLGYLMSKEFYEISRSIEVNQITTSPEKTMKFLNAAMSGYLGRSFFFPAVFNENILTVPEDFNPAQSQITFDTSDIRVVIIGAHALFGTELVGKKVEKKLFRETFFTDENMGLLLKNFKSPIANANPESFISSDTQILSDYTLAKATRVSITDPYYIDPIKLNDEYYFGGALDLFPIEAAFKIGKEVAIPFPRIFPLSWEGVAINVFNFHVNERLREVSKKWSNYWIDFSDADIASRDFDFTPSVEYKYKITGIEFISIFPVPYIDVTPYIKSNIPERDINNPDEAPQAFKDKIMAQWNYGHMRGLEAFKAKMFNYKEHIRVPIK